MKKIVSLLCIAFSVCANPFLFDVPSNPEDFSDIQQRIRALNLDPLLDSLYPKTPFWRKNPLQKKSDFSGRIHRAIRQTFIHTAEHKLPQKKLISINGGGPHCIVSFSSYDGVYPTLISSIPSSLEKVGFKGYFLSLIGGYPNPTGEEIRYCAVPYAFKIFAMLEARKLGFDTVLWIDAAFLPLQDPIPLFSWIEKSGCFFQFKKNNPRYLLPSTKDVLFEKTGVDMYATSCIRARIIGLDFRREKVRTLIKEYYELVKLGTPFLSCFPEEYVIGALLAKDADSWLSHPFVNLVKNERKLHKKDISSLQKEGFFFMLQQH